MGRFEGVAAIRGYLEDFSGSYDECREPEEVHDLGNGVAVLRQSSDGPSSWQRALRFICDSRSWSRMGEAMIVRIPTTSTSTRPVLPPNASPRNGGRRCRRRTWSWSERTRGCGRWRCCVPSHGPSAHQPDGGHRRAPLPTTSRGRGPGPRPCWESDRGIDGSSEPQKSWRRAVRVARCRLGPDRSMLTSVFALGLGPRRREDEAH